VHALLPVSVCTRRGKGTEGVKGECGVRTPCSLLQRLREGKKRRKGAALLVLPASRRVGEKGVSSLSVEKERKNEGGGESCIPERKAEPLERVHPLSLSLSRRLLGRKRRRDSQSLTQLRPRGKKGCEKKGAGSSIAEVLRKRDSSLPRMGGEGTDHSLYLDPFGRRKGRGRED